LISEETTVQAKESDNNVANVSGECEKTPNNARVAAFIRWLHGNDDIGEFNEEAVAERYRELYAKHVADTKCGKQCVFG